MATERLQKVLARAGVASRRAAEELIAAGRVRVDGRVVTELGTKVDPRSAKIEVDGKRAFAELFVYVVLHKPRNVVSTMSDPEGRPSVHEYLKDVPGRVYPVGRLDFATSGVLLVTNDGEFAAAMLHPRKAVPKTYVVKVQGLMQEEDMERWRKGVRLPPARSAADDPRGGRPEGRYAAGGPKGARPDRRTAAGGPRDDQDEGPTLPAKVKFLRHEEGKTWLELTITEGRNQQIRRMGDATGFRVMRLARLKFAGIDSESLPPGRWRYLTYDELSTLKADFGVPRKLVSPPAPVKVAKPQRPERKPWHGARPQGPGRSGGTGAGRPGGTGEGRAEGTGAGRAGGTGADRPRGTGGGRGGGTGAGRGGGTGAGHERGGTQGARYGGGAPGRRDPGVREDWGGGIQRGSSGSRDEQRAPRDEAGGRGGKTRTTGTGGGVGAGEGSYRVKGRRGW